MSIITSKKTKPGANGAVAVTETGVAVQGTGGDQVVTVS